MIDPVVEYYDQEAKRYDRRWRSYIQATIDAVASALPLSGGERLLDAPCGTGALQTWLKRAYPSVEVVGVDASRAMLAEAMQKHPESTYSWIEADVERLPFPDGAFDRIVCANSVHCFARPAAVLSEFRRVLSVNGRLLILDWCDDYLLCKVCGLWLRLFDPAHRRMFTSLQCRNLLAESGLDVARWRRFRVGLVWGLMLFECTKAD